MDNYLSHRWPAQVSAEWQPEQYRPKKKRRWLAVLLILVLLAGLAAGGWFLSRSIFDRLNGETPPASDVNDPVSDLPVPEPSQPVTTVARAETGLGVTLELEASPGEMMAPQAVYNKVLPSVVSISAYLEKEGGYAAGSGVIMREDGYILTNYHVIEGGSEVSVMLLSDNSVYDALLVGYDEEYDIAVLKIDAEGLTAASFGDSDALQVGDTAYAIGNPLGYLYGTMTDGIISALRQEVEVDGRTMTLIQTSAALNSGNSGGALITATGQVVGIAVAKITGQNAGAQVESLAFAIPISDVRPYINRILATGETWRPTIGITCYAAEADGVKGIMVATVEAKSGALKAGLREFDLITHANGVPVSSLYELKRVLGEVGVGGTLTCTVLRGDEEMELSFPLIDSTDLND